MGYYTSYSLETIPEDYDGFIISTLRNVDSNVAYAIDDEGDTSDSCKWYSWEEDMTHLSKLFPETTLVLHGEGEESGDIWRAYFKDGKCEKQKARIVFDPPPVWVGP